MTRKKTCWYCGDPTPNAPIPISSAASPATMKKCSEWQNRPDIRRQTVVCDACAALLKYVREETERLKP